MAMSCSTAAGAIFKAMTMLQARMAAIAYAMTLWVPACANSKQEGRACLCLRRQESGKPVYFSLLLAHPGSQQATALAKAPSKRAALGKLLHPRRALLVQE